VSLVNKSASATRIALIAVMCAAGSADRSAGAQQAATPSKQGTAYTAADVAFMQGMIGHHSQALDMCAMASTHGAGEKVGLFCKKVIISQRDEMALMQNWLRERGEKVPDPKGSNASDMPGMDMDGDSMLMPGMLTAAQMKQLDAAKGAAWDSTFLMGMIQHHGGALTMVAKLFATAGAGQTAEIFGFATGIDADQRAEIERMQGMLSSYHRRSPQ
jgi:uncharacterized protein (DUF305 family)